MYSNNRPTAMGKMLNNYQHGLIKEEEFIVYDYLLKNSGERRLNAFCIDAFRLHKINQLAYSIYNKFGNRKNVFYSGDFDNMEMFYANHYKKFKKTVLEYSLRYNYFIKIDLKDYYNTINMKEQKFKYVDIELKNFFEYMISLGFSTLPIIQECVGLSYVATTIVLWELDRKIKEYFDSINIKIEIARYCDDLYIFFDEEITSPFLELCKIISSENFEINLEKFEHKSTNYISENVATFGYSVVVYGEELDYDYLVTEEVSAGLNTFFTNLKFVNTKEKYNYLVKEAFEIEKKAIKKKFLNDVVFSKKYDIMISQYVDKHINDMVNIFVFDPVTIVKLILKSKNNQISKLLHNAYKNLENKQFVSETIIALTVYTIDRNINNFTKNKILSKIGLCDKEYANFLEKFVL